MALIDIFKEITEKNASSNYITLNYFTDYISDVN